MNVIEHAKKIAINGHKDQVRRDGITPYIKHPLRVAAKLCKKENSDEVIATALLHDIVEDTTITLKDLKKFGFSNEIVEAVDALTHRRKENYFKYIGQIQENPIARTVKNADIIDNLNDAPTTKQMYKYGKALTMLNEDESLGEI